MRNLNFFQKIYLLINWPFALLLGLGLLLPWIPVERFPRLALLGLAMPALVLVNLLFVVYWILRGKRMWWLSALVLLLGFNSITSVYRFSSADEVTAAEGDIKVMSFNVRVFDVYRWTGREGVSQEILDVVSNEAPDVLCFQEFYYTHENKFPAYPYKYIDYKTRETGQAIFSKYPMLKKGSLNFENSGNGGIFADLRIGKDTLRVYNMHIQSYHINPDNEELSQENTLRIFGRMSEVFRRQQEQVDIFSAHREAFRGKSLVCVDLNNNQFSSIYRQVRGEGLDTFQEKGEGTGKTYFSKYFPLRIDFIFADPSMEVLEHRVIQKQLSDHYPVIARLRWKEQ